MQYYINLLSIGILMVCSICACVSNQNKVAAKNMDVKSPSIIEEITIDSVWAANKVSFALRTVGDKQFVAYYDKNRMMTVATRKTNSKIWQKNTLANQLKLKKNSVTDLIKGQF